jgi:hypothetical protein
MQPQQKLTKVILQLRRKFFKTYPSFCDYTIHGRILLDGTEVQEVKEKAN